MLSTLFTYLLLASPSQPTTPVIPPKSSPEDMNSPLVPLPTVDPMSYTYNPFGKRDPFRSFLYEKGSISAESKDPLLNYDLSKFSLTGILWGISNPKAIVTDGDGHGHIISRGTRIGRNKGQVIRILKDELIVSEEYRDPLGKLMVSEYSMKLKEGLGKK